MEIQNQIRKYKIQINELTKARDNAIARENNIYDAEMQRISIKTSEFYDDCKCKINELNNKIMYELETLNKLNKNIESLNNELNTYTQDKFKLRDEVLLQIHAINQSKKQNRKNRHIYIQQLNEIKENMNKKNKFITNYENIRRQINEDYYNWRSEMAETNTKINSLTIDDKKRPILENYLHELELDIRANPETRYSELETNINAVRREIELDEYQYTKLSNYVDNFITGSDAAPDLAIATYLKESKAKIPALKQQIGNIESEKQKIQLVIDEYEQQIKDLETVDVPDLLKEQTARAIQRKQISKQRVDSEYDPLIINLNDKISNLEQLILGHCTAGGEMPTEVSVDATTNNAHTTPDVPNTPGDSTDIVAVKTRKQLDKERGKPSYVSTNIF